MKSRSAPGNASRQEGSSETMSAMARENGVDQLELDPVYTMLARYSTEVPHP